MLRGCREGKDAPKAAMLLAPAVGKVLYTQAEGPRGWKVRRCLSEDCRTLVSRWALMCSVSWRPQNHPTCTRPMRGVLQYQLSCGCHTAALPSRPGRTRGSKCL